jgi:hypothetical protein
LLLKYNVDPCLDDNKLFRICCYSGWSNLLNTLLNKYTVKLDDQYVFLAIRNSRINILHILLYKCKTKIENTHIKYAIQCNSIDVIKYFIKCKININNHELFHDAIKYENNEIVKLFIDNKIDLCANNNAAIKEASIVKDTKIMKLIITDINVDPTVDNNKPLCNAVYFGNYSNVKFLLSLVNRPVDPTCNNYNLLKVAHSYCSLNNQLFWTYYDILLLLYYDYRVDKQKIPEITLFISNMNTIHDNESIPPLIPIDNIYMSPRHGRTDEIS